jgi:oxygen-independent coproporphyrinogen-3 oxidase
VARGVFDRVSFDLICARQDQTREAWAAELDQALAMAVDHISLYQLTIEPGTAFAARQEAGGLRGLPDEDLGADLYEMTVERCEAAGLELYEVSNFARPGAECRHNLLYWSGGDYAGVGPGAHGRLTIDGRRIATEQVSAPGAWLSRVEQGELRHEREQEISVHDQAIEYLLMGMRKREGVALSALSALGDAGASVRERAQPLEDAGLVEAVSGRIRATPRGRLLLDRLVAELAG